MNNNEWFFDLFNVEENERHIKSDFNVSGTTMYSVKSDEPFEIGNLQIKTLDEIRRDAQSVQKNMKSKFKRDKLSVKFLKSNIFRQHSKKENEGALIQVSSNFSCLQDKDLNKQSNITDYAGSYSQGNQSCIATAPSTLYRRYFHRKINLLDSLEKDKKIDNGKEKYWILENGQIVLNSRDNKIDKLNKIIDDNKDGLRDNIMIGYHEDIEVVYSMEDKRIKKGRFFENVHKVGYALCSPLDIKLNRQINKKNMEKLSELILEAQYEATLWAGVINANSTSNNRVILTIIGYEEDTNLSIICKSIFRAINIFKKKQIPLNIIINFDYNNDSEKENLYKPLKANINVTEDKKSKKIVKDSKSKSKKRVKAPKKDIQIKNRDKMMKDIEKLIILVNKLDKKKISSRKKYKDELYDSLVKIGDVIEGIDTKLNM